MNRLQAWIFVFACLAANISHAQTVTLSYPIANGVIQRSTGNNATITIAGQLISNNLAVTLSYRFRPVSATGVTGAPGAATNLSLAANGMFYVLPIVNKGWYLCEILLNGVVYATAKFGVGDVFIIAGQSNAQGTGNDQYALPSSANIPEWIIGTSEDGNCTKKLPQSFSSLFSLNTTDQAKRYGRLGPTGNSIWAYATLGKQISDANGGMPVAFFNTASGGTTIVEWKQGIDGVEAKHPFTGAQMCLGYMGGSAVAADYYGQPYTPLKTALNYYGSLFGVRAILWHQGETDSDTGVNQVYKASSAVDYQVKLQAIIAKSRSDFGAPGLTWFVSKATISQGGALNAAIRQGQSNAAQGSPTISGPDTDYVNGSAGITTANDGGDEYRYDGTHFFEGSGSIKGLTWLANKWYAAVGSSGSPIAASYVPKLTYSKNADLRTLSAPPGGVQYVWNTININTPAVPGGNASVFTTADKYLGIQCYMKDATGNWHISGKINLGKYDNQREGAGVAEEKEDELPGFELNAYPNPYTDHFTIAFEVPEDNSHVTLEIIDTHGQILKSVVNNPHARGKWKYPFKMSSNDVSETLFCRLKINEHYTVKKLIHLKNN